MIALDKLNRSRKFLTTFSQLDIQKTKKAGGSFITTTDIVIGTGGTAITIAHSTITNVGKITPTDPKTCIACIVGRYQPETGQASCLPCIPGSFMNITGALKCFTCGKNEKSEDAGAKECEDCGVGKKSDEGSAKW